MKVKLLILSVFVIAVFSGAAFAEEGHDHGLHKGSMKVEEVSTDDANVGNKICPVSGEKIGGEMGEGVEVEHEGKTYNLCCKMCAKDFTKDPAKYIKIINEELENSEHEDHGDHEEKEDHEDDKESHEDGHDHGDH